MEHQHDPITPGDDYEHNDEEADGLPFRPKQLFPKETPGMYTQGAICSPQLVLLSFGQETEQPAASSTLSLPQCLEESTRKAVPMMS